MMHGSTAGLRPRQRTFTSCTECRRRKQRCNQAKDRPCNNCARRYPPVICTYESSSPPPSIDRIIDLRDDQVAQEDIGRRDEVPNSAYVQPSQSDMSDLPAAAVSDHSSYYNSGHGYYAAATTRADYRAYQGDSTSNNQYVASTTAAGYGSVSAGYYQNVQTTNYNSVGPSHSGYYPSEGQQRTDWLSTNGDPGAFVGASSTDYYYVSEPDPEAEDFRPESPRR